MKIPFLYFLAMLALIMTGKAHLGETPLQCQIRYGDPISQSEDVTVYKKSGFIIAVHFYEGKADRLAYVHEEANQLGFHKEFSENEIEILKKTMVDQPWTKVESKFGSHTWQSKDGLAYCSYEPLSKERMLAFLTSDCVKREEKETKSQEAKNLQGL